MVKLIAATAIKAGSFLVASILVGNALGLPIGTTWWDGFICGFGLCVILGSAVSSMIEPTKDSRPLYIFLFRFGHLVLNRSTAYFVHSSMWSLFVHDEVVPRKLSNRKEVDGEDGNS